MVKVLYSTVFKKQLYIQMLPSSVQYHINLYYSLSIVTRGLRQVCFFKKLKKYSLKEETGLIMILNSNENFLDLVETLKAIAQDMHFSHGIPLS